MRSTTTHVRARCRCQEASHEATAVGVVAGLQLLGWLADRLEGLFGFEMGDIHVTVVQRERGRALGGVCDHKLIGAGGNCADGSWCAS